MYFFMGIFFWVFQATISRFSWALFSNEFYLTWGKKKVILLHFKTKIHSIKIGVYLIKIHWRKGLDLFLSCSASIGPFIRP